MPEKGSYLYGVVASKEAADLGEVGLDGLKVYSVLYKNIADFQPVKLLQYCRYSLM